MSDHTGDLAVPADLDEVRSLLARLTRAWNAGDASAYARLFTADADYVTFFGLHLRGRAAIEESHRLLFDGPLKGSRLTGDTGGETSVQVRFPHPDVAVTIATGGSALQEEYAPDPSRNSVATLVAVRGAGGAKGSDASDGADGVGRWRFTSFHNTRRSAPGGGAPGAALGGDSEGERA